MNQYFYEDQVYTIDKKGSVKFGLVVENEVSNEKKFSSKSISIDLIIFDEMSINLICYR